jgi:hypothetical protein
VCGLTWRSSRAPGLLSRARSIGRGALFGLQLVEHVAEGLLQVGCDGVVRVRAQHRFQLFQGGANFLRQTGRGISAGTKSCEEGRKVEFSRPGIASRMMAQRGVSDTGVSRQTVRPAARGPEGKKSGRASGGCLAVCPRRVLAQAAVWGRLASSSSSVWRRVCWSLAASESLGFASRISSSCLRDERTFSSRLGSLAG